MEALIEFIESIISNFEVSPTLIMVLAGMTITGLAFGVGNLLLGLNSPARRRLLGVAESGHGSLDEGDKGLRLQIDTLVGPVAQYVLPKEELERSEVKARLTHAGFRQPNALQTYYAIKTALALGLPLLVLLASNFFPEVTTPAIIFYTFFAGAIGLFGPNYVLEKVKNKRIKRLRDGFPDALDLLVVCVESGLGLSQALQRVADELIVSHPELSAELSLVNAEVRAGVDRVNALKNLAARTGLEDIKGLVSLLVQTLRFGTSVAETLRVYSEEFRDKRMQRAEEQAAKIGTKLIFPLVVFMFPAFFVVAIGPSVIRLAEVFSQLGN